MTLKIFRRPPVSLPLAVPVFGPPANLTAVATVPGNVLNWDSVPGARYCVFRRSATDRDDPQNLNNPWAWERLTAEPIGTLTYTDKYARELEFYEYRVFAVNFLGSWSTPTVASVTTAKWAPQNHLCHWTEDVTQGGFLGWFFAGAAGQGSASGSAGNQTVTFTAASQHLSIYVPCYTLIGRTYTYYYRMQGTAGQTIAFHTVDDENSGSPPDYVHTFTGGVDDIVFTSTFTTSGRRMRVGFNTYTQNDGALAMTARVVNFKRMRVAAGNIASATMIAGYEKTEGPGTTWCEPLQINTQHVTGSNPLTVSSWHRSLESLCLQTFRIQVTNQINFVGARSISRGHHITGSVANVKFTATNTRFYGLNPKAASKFFGRVCTGSFDLANITQCYAERTSGVHLAGFTGRGAGAIKLTRSLFRDIDGRYVNADGSYIRSSWGSASGAPGGTVLGWESVQMIYIYKLHNANAPTVFVLPYEIPGVEVSYNECVNRPGFSRHEDLINFDNMVGTEDSPVLVHHNRLWTSGPWDMYHHAAWAAGTTPAPYKYDSIVGDAPGGPGSPGGFSGTAILPSDLFAFDRTYIFKNNNFIEIYSNLAIGVSAIISLQAGRNQSIRSNKIISSGQMMSGLAAATQNRKAGVQITHYAVENGSNPRAFTDYMAIVNFAKDGTAASSGATTISVTALPSALPNGAMIHFNNGAWALLTSAAASGATSLSTTGLSKAVPANEPCRGGMGEVVWVNMEAADNDLRVSGSNAKSWTDATRQRPSTASSAGVTPEEEWAELGRWQQEAARAGMSTGPITA
ncbi:hypothetical protein [Deinococcus aquatilis]|uniref:hypothetical protein n=1 Tax=Deinococcus aquatilis TaxID=519440 RepID=UPI0003809CAD|nr:hypothetical protein [Deinococcus aquatilis]